MSHQDLLTRCIEHCLACMVACNHCAMSCTQESDIHHMSKCIRMNIACAQICQTTANLLSLSNDKSLYLCRVCAEICDECARECVQHQHDHCQQCAQSCLACADACRRLIA